MNTSAGQATKIKQNATFGWRFCFPAKHTA
jgi:hypothetical protein